MKNYLHDIALIIIGAFFGIAIFGSVTSHNYEMTTEDPSEPEIQYVYIEKEPVIETVYVPYEEPFYRNLTDEDKDYLCDISMRESEGESVVGQAWVMYCVLCRAEAYGKSIKEVCESDAFKSSRSRSGKKPNENCLKALALIEEGWEPRPLWFRAGQYHDFGEPLCKVGNHYFSCK